MSRDTLNDGAPQSTDLIVVARAGGFITANILKYQRDKAYAWIRGVDKKRVGGWYLCTRDRINVLDDRECGKSVVE